MPAARASSPRSPLARRLGTLLAIATIASTGALTGTAIPGARAAAPETGAAPSGNVTSPVTFRPATPVDIDTDQGGTLPLIPDPTIGRGPTLGPPVKPPTARTELPDLRTEHSRTFVNPDGTYSMEAIEGRMHYLADDGTWQPMDLGLVAAVEGAYDLRVKSSDRFPCPMCNAAGLP